MTKKLFFALFILVPVFMNAFLEQDLALYFHTDSGKTIGLTGTPYPAYSSDSGAGAGLQFILFDATNEESVNNPFNLQFDMSFTTEGEKKFELDYRKDYSAQQWAFFTHLEYKIMPSDFWGIGADTPEQNKESYKQDKQVIALTLQKNYSESLSLGPILSYYRYKFLEKKDSLMLAQGDIPGSENSLSLVGTGFVFDYNKTDSRNYPRKGYRLINENVFYLSVDESNYHFYSGSLDLRAYYPLFENHVICGQILSQNTSDTPPFQLMPKQGGPFIMRGYANGRFIDKQFLATQMEYRSPFWMKLGFAAFASLGNSYKNFRDFDLSNTHFTYGTGIRLNISKANMLNIRGDIAFSKEGHTIYFKVGESF